jgi:hypothetical protein
MLAATAHSVTIIYLVLNGLPASIFRQSCSKLHKKPKTAEYISEIDGKEGCGR